MKNQGTLWIATLLVSAAITPLTSHAFDSGSDGTYGDLIVTNIGVTFVSMPSNGVFNCTNIFVATNCVLKFTPNSLNTPVYLLAKSNIVINGIVDVGGEDGQTNGAVGGVAGPGGFGGGAAGISGSPFGRGQGPGGGQLNDSFAFGHGGGFGTKGYGVGNNLTYGNQLLVPLIGGSGGAGVTTGSSAASSGGGGGGALLLASSTDITLSGRINARGGGNAITGTSRFSGGGSGGAVRFVAPAMTLPGAIDVSGGTNAVNSSGGYGGNGRVRIDSPGFSGAVNIMGNGKGNPSAPVVSYGRSMFVFPPASPQLYFVEVASNAISSSSATNITLASGSSTNLVANLEGIGFLGTVGIQVVATPANGTPYSTNITMVFPTTNAVVQASVTLPIPVGTTTKLNAYASYGVQP